MRKGIRMTGLRELVRTRGGWSGRGAGQQHAWQGVRAQGVPGGEGACREGRSAGR